jgi:serine/threonine-protein kinase
MSPEQARGSDIDRRSDVFAAGVVLFEALTGALPFGRDTSDPSAFLLRIVLDDIPPASSLRSELPVAIDTVVARALERVREERYQTAGEMRNALVAAVAPASDAEVRGLVELWSQVALAARRAEIRRALVGAAATVAQTPTGPRAETTSAPTRSEKPRSADATAPAPPAPSERATGLAKIAVGAGAATAVVAVLAVGVLGGMLWRDRGGGSEIVRDTGSATPIAVDRAVPDANTTAPAAAAMLDAAPSDAGTLDAGPMDAGPMDAGMRDAVTTAATTAAVVTAHAAKPHTVAPPPTTTAPPRPRAAAGSASSATKTRIGFTADGALLLREHEVRLHMRLVRNTTQGDSAAIESRFDSYAWYTLKLYGQSVTVYLPHDTPPPAGTMTVTYHLRHNAFSPLPEHVSTFGLGDSFDAAVGGQAFMTYLATILDHGHADLTGEIVLEGTFAVK